MTLKDNLERFSMSREREAVRSVTSDHPLEEDRDSREIYRTLDGVVKDEDRDLMLQGADIVLKSFIAYGEAEALDRATR